MKSASIALLTTAAASVASAAYYGNETTTITSHVLVTITVGTDSYTYTQTPLAPSQTVYQNSTNQYFNTTVDYDNLNLSNNSSHANVSNGSALL